MVSEVEHEIVLVAAMGRNRVIGADGGMPWYLPADLKHFKAVTLGHPVVMGRRTFEAIARPLPGRRNIVVSRTLASPPEGCELARSLGAAMELSGNSASMVIGGGELYRQALPIASRMELTLIDVAPDGDTFFPAWSKANWNVTGMHVRAADSANPYRLVFCSLTRASADLDPDGVPRPEIRYDERPGKKEVRQ